MHKTALFTLVFWILFALAAPLMAPWDFYDPENIIMELMVKSNGEEIMMRSYSPHPPSLRHPLGTDEFGYDYLTSLLYGVR